MTDLAVVPEVPNGRERPKALSGATQRITTGYGNVYVEVNDGPDGEPFEVFANIGNSGGFTNSFTTALGKLSSAAIRAGVSPETVAEYLVNIRSPKTDYDNGDKIFSIPDAIAVGIYRHIYDCYSTPVKGDVAPAPGEEKQ
jgi:ribonucleoside-diphosphate reductase alpha chain